MFHWKPEGCYRYRLCTVIAPFWLTEHLWTSLTPFWLSTDDIMKINEQTSSFKTSDMVYQEGYATIGNLTLSCFCCAVLGKPLSTTLLAHTCTCILVYSITLVWSVFIKSDTYIGHQWLLTTFHLNIQWEMIQEHCIRYFIFLPLFH